MILADDHQSRLPSFHCRGPYVSQIRQFFNFLGCLFIIPVYYFITGCTKFLLTLDLMISIFVAEYNRWANEKRTSRLQETPLSTPTHDVEKAMSTWPNIPAGEVTRCMAVIVGYHEDPELFYRALESYRATEGLEFTLVGVDGDQAADTDMVRVFQMVYPKNSAVIHLDEPLGEIAMRTYSKLVDPNMCSPEDIEYCNELTIAHCCHFSNYIYNYQNHTANSSMVAVLLYARHCYEYLFASPPDGRLRNGTEVSFYRRRK